MLLLHSHQSNLCQIIPGQGLWQVLDSIPLTSYSFQDAAAVSLGGNRALNSGHRCHASCCSAPFTHRALITQHHGAFTYIGNGSFTALLRAGGLCFQRDPGFAISAVVQDAVTEPAINNYS